MYKTASCANKLYLLVSKYRYAQILYVCNGILRMHVEGYVCAEKMNSGANVLCTK